MRWSRALKVMSLALAASLAGCNDMATAPSEGLSAAPAIPSSLITVEYMANDSTSADVTVDYRGGTFQLGPHAIYFSRYSICDPNTSTYGLGHWDDPCTVADRPIRIHAQIVSGNGKEWIDFSPSLRFAPLNKSNKGVYLYMKVPDNYQLSADDPLEILWMQAPGLPGLDESIGDPDLATQYNADYDVVYRRIKHFTGYMVAAD